MYLEYCQSKLGNVGDDLNPWLFPKLLPKAFDDTHDRVAFLGIGTILDQNRVIRSKLHKNKANIVFSSGAGFDIPPTIDKNWHIYCVRGKHTATQLKINQNKAIADGAYLLRNIVNYHSPDKKHKIAFIPHHSSENFINWDHICQLCNIKFISTRQSVDSFLDDILASELVLTEAMHGAIISDALRTPWIPVQYSPKFMIEKWMDFVGAFNMELTLSTLPFHAQKPLNLGQMIEVSIKRGLNKLSVGPLKWGRLPNAYKKASPQEIDILCESIHNIISTGQIHQSNDFKVEQVTEQLSLKIEQLYNDFLSGKFYD